MRAHFGYCIIAAALAIVLSAGQALPQAAPQVDWRQRFRAYDTNGDGRIDREEFQRWMTEGFYFRDKERKGYLTADDLRDVMAPETVKALSASTGGKLTLPEYLNAAFQDFAAADVNKDGALTMEEIDQYLHRGK